MYDLLLNSNHYSSYNISIDTIYNLAIVFSVILISFSIFSLKYVKENKRLAWMVSLLNSFIMSVIGVLYIFFKASDVLNIVMKGKDGRNIFHGIDNVAAVACLWFGLANLTDLIFGFLYYPKHQGLITAYFHHSIFIWIMIACTTGDGLFLKCEKFAPSFVFMCVEEIPTFILALGTVEPSYRSDLGFGITFFIFRLVYHGMFLVSSIYYRADIIVSFLYSLTFTMHVFWFHGWASKYSTYNKKDKKVQKQT